MYLVDTNIWLERLLDQERSAKVGQFLAEMLTRRLLMTDFTLHSIGIILSRFDRREVFIRFVDDVLIEGGVRLISVQPSMMHQVIDVMEQFNLDFDDAYQYVAAKEAGAVLVSYDGDFDRTVRQRQTPAQVLTAGDATPA